MVADAGRGDDGKLADRALAEPQRARILAELRAAASGLDVSELATALGLHPNTIRWHLGQLVDAGLVGSRSLHRGTPGRPRIIYEAVEGPPQQVESYRFLSELLASALARSPDGVQEAEAAGRAWGRFLVERPSPYARISDEEAAERVVQLLEDHGFAPELQGSVVGMHRCPFKELVDSYGAVICTTHRGLLAGALEELDAGIEIGSLEPYARPGVCLAYLAPAAV